jgi:hypothetical protein
MKDSLGIPITLGDSVAVAEEYYVDLDIFKVVNFTDRYVALSNGDLYNSSDLLVVTQQLEQNRVNHPELHI